MRSSSIQPRHCVFDFSDEVVTVTALDTHALVEVNGNILNCSVILNDSDIIRLGGIFEFVFRRSFVSLEFMANAFECACLTLMFADIRIDPAIDLCYCK